MHKFQAFSRVRHFCGIREQIPDPRKNLGLDALGKYRIDAPLIEDVWSLNLELGVARLRAETHNSKTRILAVGPPTSQSLMHNHPFSHCLFVWGGWVPWITARPSPQYEGSGA